MKINKDTSALWYFPGFLLAFTIIASLFAPDARAAKDTSECTIAGAPIDVFYLDVPEISPTLQIGDSITGGPVSFRQVNVANCFVDRTDNSVTSESGGVNYDIIATGTRVGVYGGRETFATNVPGIGIQIGNQSGVTGDPPAIDNVQELIPDWINLGQHTTGGWIYPPAKDSNVGFYTTSYINLIKTANVIGSGSLYGVYAKFVVAIMNEDGSYSPVTVRFALNGVIQPAGCIITGGQNLNIVLDDVEKKDLPGVGSSWGESSPENIQLTCNKGVSVDITFSGNQSPDSSDASVLQNNGSAKGIGVQLLNSQGNAYSLGEKVTAITDADINETIPVSARYIRTGDLSAGTVEASATYTLNYE